MTVVITYLASDNARNRRRARRAEAQSQVDADSRLARKIAVAGSGCSLNVARATSAPSLREKREELSLRISTKYQKVSNEAGRQIHAVQKMRGKSIPLI